MTIIYLLRHGQYQNQKNIAPFRLPGFPLTKLGREQIDKVADFLKDKNIKLIYSSSILRCKQTAEIIGRQLGLKVKFSDQILETKTPFQGMALEKFKQKGQDTFIHPFHLEHGGETINEVYQRAMGFLNKMLVNNKGKNILIVSHGDPLMVLIYSLADKNLAKYFAKTRDYIPMGGLVKLEFEDKKFKSFKQINY